jgi:membrane-associated HD superfamily phosphohydrolase
MEHWKLIMAVSGMLIGFGIILLLLEKHKKETGRNWKQVIGMVFIMPVILVLASLYVIDSETISVLLGTIVGYIFRLSQEEVTQ